MAIKTYKPTTPSRRYMTNLDSSDITAKASVRSLLVKLPASAGRNSNGKSLRDTEKQVLRNSIESSISKERSSVSKVQ